MLKELSLVAPLFEKQVVNTVYFGGGTPSLLGSEELATLQAATKEWFTLDNYAEVTLEANPDDINPDKLMQWKLLGINRLSIGIQSFQQNDLEWMNRAHNAEQALHSLALVKYAGFTNFSVDLIYGTPLLDDVQWKKNIETVISLKVPHISCYALTVEPSTALQKMIRLNKKQDIDPEKQADQFLLLMRLMKEAGYEHYEISNFALPGFRSKHNSSYWQGKFYTGIGPSAHSYFGSTRRWNISNNQLYITSLQNDIISYEEEKLSATQQLNEYIMISLRTIEGLDLEFIKKTFGEDKSLKVQEQCRKFEKSGMLETVNNTTFLTRQGKLFADGIAADLFFTTV